MHALISSCEVTGFDPNIEDDDVDPQRGPLYWTGEWKNRIRVKTACNDDLNLPFSKCSFKTVR